MPHVKRPTKKSRGASSSMEPPPQDHHLTQWFYNKEDFDLYLSNFAPRKVVPPRNEHEAPQEEEEAQPQEPHDNPSKQPSMRDLMELIQSMEHNMGTRLERIEQNQTRISQRIRRMEQYLYSEDEGDDEDEDQD
ncbi:hypothetical protein PIB30_059403 [Stylosanthes scabra]|uniref:Uncharacterized protein n=1 Tax=Stylosanthes scabra TaxID=79078 RepID=A0ABU6XLS3_9FABA|nr:hypothetical protein [Stylosanthes scabra]